jgi:hypothetical protein
MCGGLSEQSIEAGFELPRTVLGLSIGGMSDENDASP